MVGKGKKFERDMAKARKGRHHGGPGEPDYTRGRIEGEVKDWKRRMGRADVMREAQKGRDEIVSKEGFTEGAIGYRDRYRPKLKLFHGRKKI